MPYNYCEVSISTALQKCPQYSEWSEGTLKVKICLKVLLTMVELKGGQKRNCSTNWPHIKIRQKRYQHADAATCSFGKTLASLVVGRQTDWSVGSYAIIVPDLYEDDGMLCLVNTCTF